MGVTPLLMSGAFFLLHAIFRNSGGRYILPTDWVSIFYFSIGLSSLSVKVIHAITGKLKNAEAGAVCADWGALPPPAAPTASPLRRAAPFLSATLALFLIGCLLPVVELSIPKRYTETKATQMLDALYQSAILDETQKNSLLTFVESGGLIYPGRALYPTFYLAGAYEPGSRPIFQQPYSRLTFYLVGPIAKAVVLPLAKSPAYFPNTADALVFLCPDGKVLAAAAFDPAGQPATFVSRSDLAAPADAWLCPLPEVSTQP